jgi:hypothetical protein
MKAIHNKPSEPEKTEWKFPCLGRMDGIGIVILFCMKGVGAVVHSGDVKFPVGYHYACWNMDIVTPLPSTESITLQND